MAKNMLPSKMKEKATQKPDVVALYLTDVAGYHPLSAQEERELARKIRRGERARVELAQNGHDQQEVHRLLRAVEEGREARNHLVQANGGLVTTLAARYLPSGIPLADLIQEGNLGLIRAAELFDPDKGYRFSTYAVWWIMQRLERVLAREQFSLRLPLHAYRELHKVKDAQARLAQLLHGDPRAEDLATETDMSVSKVERLLQAAQLFASLSQPVGEESELGDFLADDREEPVREAELSALKEALETALDTLPPRLALIVRLYYGLKDGHCYTLGEIGERLGISRERVRQLVVLAMRKLRHPCRTRRLRDFVRG